MGRQKKVIRYVEDFNERFPVGSKVQWRLVASAAFPYEELTVKHPACFNYGNQVFWSEERSGCLSIEPEFVNYKSPELLTP